jgi:hypothetical protein
MRLELDRHKIIIELYGQSYYYEIAMRLNGILYTDSGVRYTFDECLEVARKFLADKVREAVA